MGKAAPTRPASSQASVLLAASTSSSGQIEGRRGVDTAGSSGELLRESFRWEAEMTSLVATQIDRLLPQGRSAHLVVGEVPTAQGIADILAVRFDAAAIRRRLESGTGPLCSPLKVRSLTLMREDRGTRVATLAQRVGSNERALMRSTIRPLAEMGLVELDGHFVRSTGVWRPVAGHLTAVELSLELVLPLAGPASEKCALSALEAQPAVESARRSL